MNRKKALLMVCALGFGLSAESVAVTITVDGDLNDWGLNWSDSGKNHDWKPTDGIFYTVEDFTGGLNRGGFVNPGYGGQAYDAEALYVTLDTDYLYIALVTGHNPNTKQGGGDYAAGDFALNFWSGTDNGTYEFGIQTPHESNNIGLFSTNVYRTTNDDWLKDPFWKTGAVTSLNTNSRSQLNKATMSIQLGPQDIGGSFGPRWIYEVSVPTSVFGDFTKNSSGLNISWTMNCANDVITVKDDIPTIDEPPVWALLGLTLPVMFWRRRRSSGR